MHTHCTVRFVLSNVLRLLFMFVMRLTFTKFACIILMHWHVISIVSKMASKLLWVKCENQWTTCKYGVHECQVKIELYCIHKANLLYYICTAEKLSVCPTVMLITQPYLHCLIHFTQNQSYIYWDHRVDSCLHIYTS